MASYILTIDQGTTSSRCLIFCSETFRVVAHHSVAFQQIFPRPSWVEHDLDEIWQSVRISCLKACEKAAEQEPHFTPQRIACIGITNQRETLCFLDSEGRALRRAIVWQCKRSADLCRELKSAGREEILRSKTGLPLDCYFSASKLLWALREEPDIAQLWKSGRLLVGTMDSFLILRLSSGKQPSPRHLRDRWVTEPSNASRTLLCSLQEGWERDLLEAFEIPLPGQLSPPLATIQDSHSLFGRTQGLDFLPDGIPITGVLGDQQAATLGQQCLQPYQAKCTYGTGAFLLAYAGLAPAASQYNLLSTVGWQLHGKRHYLLEGSCFVAGAGMDYLQNQWNFFDNPRTTSDLICNLTASPRVYFVPALAGMGAPYWCSDARGALLGLSRDTTSHQVIRAMVEGITFTVADLIASMSADLEAPLSLLKVDGGFSQNDVAMQFQADLLGMDVLRGQEVEATALGAALMAAYGAGVRTSLELPKTDYADSRSSAQRFFSPAFTPQQRREHLAGWKRAVEAVLMLHSSP